MKKTTLLILLIMIVMLAKAQAPEGINYQAVARNGTGNLIVNSNLNVRMTILSGVGGAVQVYQEAHGVTTNEYGLFNLQLGKGAPISGVFSNISWGTDEYHVQVEVDNGSGFVDMGKSQMMSVPYALYAENSGSGSGTTYTAGSGLTLTGTTFSNSAPDQTVSISGGGASSISGTYPNFTITSIDNNTTYTGGTGITLSGTTFNAQTTTALWNANQLQGRTISTTAPTTNQVLGWNGSQWTPQTVSGSSSPWTVSGSNINRITGNIGVGATSSTFSKFLTRSYTSDPDIAIYGSSQGIHAANEGVRGRGINGTSSNNGVVGIADGDNVSNYGMWAQASSTTGTNSNYGLFGYALGNAGSTNYGILGEAFAGAGTNYAGYFNGNLAYTGTLTNPSDKRLKKNVIPLESSLDKIAQLNVYTYEYDAKGEYVNLNLSKGKQFGFLAQELETVFPTLIHDNKVPDKKTLKEDGSFKYLKGGAEYKSVNHIGMIPILTKAIQEQQDLIKEQNQTIKNQQLIINQFELRLSKLENK